MILSDLDRLPRRQSIDRSNPTQSTPWSTPEPRRRMGRPAPALCASRRVRYVVQRIEIASSQRPTGCCCLSPPPPPSATHLFRAPPRPPPPPAPTIDPRPIRAGPCLGVWGRWGGRGRCFERPRVGRVETTLVLIDDDAVLCCCFPLLGRGVAQGAPIKAWGAGSQMGSHIDQPTEPIDPNHSRCGFGMGPVVAWAACRLRLNRHGRTDPDASCS